MTISLKRQSLLLTLMLLFLGNGLAVEINGISYNLDNYNRTAAVIHNWSKLYTGKITIPQTISYSNISYLVTSINNGAFYNCVDVTSISIPSTVKNIEGWAFENCTGLTTISIPSGVTTINNGLFSGCSNLTSVTNLHNNITAIGMSAFKNCSKMTSIAIPSRVTTIGESAFEGCSELSSITIPSGISSVGKNAFLNTSWYNNQPDGLIYLGNIAYKYKGTMPNNTQITIKSGTKAVAAEAFKNCTSLASVVFPNSLTNIGEEAFRGCGISSLNLPSSLVSIGEEAFIYCNSLQALTLPEGVQSVGFSAFWNCGGLKSIVIPKSLVTIDRHAFNACYNLQTITVTAGNPAYDSRNNCNAIIEKSTNKLITGTINTVIPEGVEAIGSRAFTSSTMSSLVIPSTVKSLDDDPFDCSNMKSIVVDERNPYLNSASNCNAIIETATNTILYGCINTVMPKSITKIGAYAFMQCGWTEFAIPEGIVDVGNCAFWCNRKLTSVSLPSTLQNITGQNIFSQCDKLKTVICYSQTPPTSQYGIGFPNSGRDMTLYVPQNTKGAYEASNVWKNFGNIIELGNQEPEAYAVLSTDQTTLSFYFDTQKGNRQGTVYTADQFRTTYNEDGWSSFSRNVSSVVFDDSFADYDGLTSTKYWFHTFTSLKTIHGLTNLNTSNVTDMSFMFDQCSNLTSIDLSHFNTDKVTNMQYMFYYCRSLTNIDVNNFNTEKAQFTTGMFGGCSGLTSLDLSNFNTGCVLDMGYMFKGCSGLTSLDLSKFNTERVYGMDGMFQNSNNLLSLDLRGWNTSRVTYMDSSNPDNDWGMFSGCSSLVTIKVSEGWNTDNVTSSAHMFNGCVSLVGGDGTKFNPNFIDKTKAYAGPGGYLTMEGQETNADDLQNYLNSLEDTGDTMTGGSYSRNFKNTDWQSLYLPFDLNYSGWMTDSFEVARFDGIDVVEGQPVLAATIMESGKVRANTPYLIRSKNNGGELGVEYGNETNVNYSIRSVSYSTDDATYTFTGNYEDMTGMHTAQQYRLMGGWLNVPTSDSESLPPFRWYMTINGTQPIEAIRGLKVRINHESDDATAIDEVVNEKLLNDKYYDLSGREIPNGSQEKGLYIINNKKYIKR